MRPCSLRCPLRRSVEAGTAALTGHGAARAQGPGRRRPRSLQGWTPLSPEARGATSQNPNPHKPAVPAPQGKKRRAHSSSGPGPSGSPPTSQQRHVVGGPSRSVPRDRQFPPASGPERRRRAPERLPSGQTRDGWNQPCPMTELSNGGLLAKNLGETHLAKSPATVIDTDLGKTNPGVLNWARYTQRENVLNYKTYEPRGGGHTVQPNDRQCHR